MSGSSRTSARSRIRPSSKDEHDDSHRNQKPYQKITKHRRIANHNSLQIMDVNLITLLGLAMVAFLVIVSLIYHLVRSGEPVHRLRVVTPFDAPKVTDLPMFQGEHKEGLYWGTYRPHVYLGIRARTPESLIGGLMWIGVKDGKYFMRHVCQDSDELGKYGWTEHNGRDYGRQVIVDQDITLTTSFLKSFGEGSGYGGDWAVQIDAQNRRNEFDVEALGVGHLFFYLADEEGNGINVGRERLDVRDGSLLASGSRKDVGDWELHLSSKDSSVIHYAGFRTPHMHNLTDLVQGTLAVYASRMGLLQLPDSLDHSSNVLVFQISAKFPFKMDIAFVSGTDSESSKVEDRVKNLTGELLDSQLKQGQREFEEKFQKSFSLTNKVDSQSMNVGRAAMANLVGGIGYFYGQSKIALARSSSQNKGDNFVPYWPAELYTAVPSRSFFPRGFLWDEGFHQLLIWRWDIHICLDIIGHWLDLMNADGWIPREQILGAEALSKVPEEFVPQHPSNGNPPTLFLILHDLVRRTKRNEFSASETSEILSFLDRAFIRLEAWFQWFNTTQAGKDKSSFYWHGRDSTTTRELNPKTLFSGLDDYPRASHPNEDERHLDLRCWMLLAADCLHSISKLLEDRKHDAKEYHMMVELLSDFEILNQIHLDKASGAYYDYGNHTEKVRLRWQERTTSGRETSGRELLREVLETPQLRLVPHVGYVSLFPFMMKIIPPESWVLGKQLDLISNRSMLWTNYGLRSLAKTSSIYMKRNTEHDPPYWRGPIWMNMNYLILSSLHHYSQEEGPYQARASMIYKELRQNLIKNVVNNYVQTGYLWEQYDQTKEGKGKGAHPFTGWTSLVLLIMAEAFPNH
ncbi:hypothetical protein Scep_018157 [Stephania cephalantha]|uniref:Mannosyl-oligosaccharide glucosidase n=1 Tax=Stephania cephalantha TaxID=152367 RepID=A0AAP0IQZ4_9MAGN